MKQNGACQISPKKLDLFSLFKKKKKKKVGQAWLAKNGTAGWCNPQAVSEGKCVSCINFPGEECNPSIGSRIPLTQTLPTAPQWLTWSLLYCLSQTLTGIRETDVKSNVNTRVLEAKWEQSFNYEISTSLEEYYCRTCLISGLNYPFRVTSCLVELIWRHLLVPGSFLMSCSCLESRETITKQRPKPNPPYVTWDEQHTRKAFNLLRGQNISSLFLGEAHWPAQFFLSWQSSITDFTGLLFNQVVLKPQHVSDNTFCWVIMTESNLEEETRHFVYNFFLPLTDQSNRCAVLQSWNCRPLPCAFLSRTVTDLGQQMCTIRLFVFKNVGRDFNQEGVQLCLIPAVKGLRENMSANM